MCNISGEFADDLKFLSLPERFMGSLEFGGALGDAYFQFAVQIAQ